MNDKNSGSGCKIHLVTGKTTSASQPTEFLSESFARAIAIDEQVRKSSEMLRSCRKTRGLSQDELARRIGIKQTVISRAENAMYSKGMHIGTLTEYLHACGYTLQISCVPISNRTLDNQINLVPQQENRDS